MKSLVEVWAWFEGKKTYLAAAVGIFVTGAYYQGYIDQDTYNALVALAGFFGLSFLRMAKK